MKVLLLDADGVVLKKEELFSERFAREYEVPTEAILPFFRGPYADCQAGSKDLKEELLPFLESWGWEGSVEEFLDYWFEDTEIDPEISELLATCRVNGIECYMASNNEHYRARHIEAVLGEQLNGYFFSADLKLKKDNPAYFETVLKELGLPASEVGFVDNEEKNVEAAAEVGLEAKLYKPGIIAEFMGETTLSEFKRVQ